MTNEEIYAKRRERADRERRMSEMAGNAAPIAGGALGTAGGAAVGSMLMPGLGTAGGAAIGGALGMGAGQLAQLALNEFGGQKSREMDEKEAAKFQRAQMLISALR